LPAGREKLLGQCAAAQISNDLAESWVEVWQQEQEIAEQKMISLLDAVERGVLTDAGAVLLLEKLAQYSLQIQRFFEEYRLQLQQKYAVDHNTLGERQEEEAQLLKLTGPILAAVKSLSFDLKVLPTQKFLKQWSEPWITQKAK